MVFGAMWIRRIKLLIMSAAICIPFLTIAGMKDDKQKRSELSAKAVFILVKDYPDHYDYCGTAFFISKDGYFLTAAHIFEKDPTAKFFAILDPLRPRELTPFEVIKNAKLQDLLVGRILRTTEEFLELAGDLPMRGSSVLAIGYGGQEKPFLKISSAEGKFHGLIDPYQIPANPPFSAREYPALATAPAFPLGFSGGPLLDEDFKVIGVVSATDSDPQVLSLVGENKPVAISVSWNLLHHAYQITKSAK